MKKIAEFVTDHWKPLLLFYLIVNSYTKLDQQQIAMAQKIDKLETMSEKINRIEVMVERIDERTGGENAKRKNSKKD
jgi:hypothetical protein